MNLLHTPEEIKHLDQQVELAHKLNKLANKHGNVAIKQEADQIFINNKQELDKYKHLRYNEIVQCPETQSVTTTLIVGGQLMGI